MRKRRESLLRQLAMGSGILGVSGGASDTTRPTVTITSTEMSPTFAETIPLTITFSEVVTGFDVGDITVVGCTLGSLTDAGNGVYTVTATPTANAITVDIAEGVAEDANNNTNTAATQFAIIALDYGLVARWDKSDITTLFQDTGRSTPVTADGQTIAGVTDKSGTTNHATQSGNAPVYKVNIQNSLSAALFTGSSSQYLITTLPSMQALSVYVVVKPTSLATIFYIVGKMGGGGNRGWMFGVQANGSVTLESYIGGVTAHAQSAAGEVTINNPYVLSARRQSGTQNIYKNAGSIATGTHAGTFDNSTAGAAIGAGFSTAAPTIFSTGYQMEILIYSHYIPDAVHTGLISSINAKWAVF